MGAGSALAATPKLDGDYGAEVLVKAGKMP